MVDRGELIRAMRQLKEFMVTMARVGDERLYGVVADRMGPVQWRLAEMLDEKPDLRVVGK